MARIWILSALMFSALSCISRGSGATGQGLLESINPLSRMDTSWCVGDQNRRRAWVECPHELLDSEDPEWALCGVVNYAVYLAEEQTGTNGFGLEGCCVPPGLRVVIPGCEYTVYLSNTLPFDVGDADGNGRIDLVDAEFFVQCLDNGGATPYGIACRCIFDFDEDGSVSLMDYSYLQRAMGRSVRDDVEAIWAQGSCE